MTSDMTFTSAQSAAIEHRDGPLLVLAGPGSGKTRVITQRIARIVESGVSPYNILAITFTNKAANEMGHRVQLAVPSASIWVTTFHRFCASLLRRHGHHIGLAPNYSIYDSSEQQSVIKRVLHELDIDAVHYPPQRVLSAISHAKNNLQSPEALQHRFDNAVGDHFQAIVARVYPEYQAALARHNAVDFDDLLLRTYALLAENESLRSELDQRFAYILVDEYQDTNRVQYELVKALSQELPNLCATGDPDQSIYGWRGARIENILQFEQDYPATTVVRLEQNFRSTSQILAAANELIGHNIKRKAKDLHTENPDGPEVTVLQFTNGQHEANALAEAIQEEATSGFRRWSDFAIFYRVNSLSRQLELAFSRARIPYQVAAGLAFYERMEVKDLLAYLKLVNNPLDEIAFNRVVNTPTRGIGKTTLNKLTDWARMQGLSLLDAASRAKQIPGLTKRPSAALESFAGLVKKWQEIAAGRIEVLLGSIIEETRYLEGWMGSLEEQAQERVANAQELLASARQYDQQHGDGSLEGFLEQCSLVSDVDALEDDGGQVTLMTLHASKGLEFPVVYVVGVEQNLIPHERSLKQNDPDELEEERRLLFVGMTRAMEELYLTQTWMRETRGRMLHSIPSDFLREMSIQYREDDPHRSSTEHWTADSEFEHSLDAPKHPVERPSQNRKTGTASDFDDVPQLKLLRGSDLLAGSAGAAPVELQQGFSIGMAVRHPRYGRGVVTQGEECRGTARLPSNSNTMSESRRSSPPNAHCNQSNAVNRRG